MKKTLIAALFLVAFGFGNAQTSNKLLDGAFWKSNPSLAVVQHEIAKGSNPAEQNGGFFDPVVMAINSKVPNEIVKFLLEQKGNTVDKKTHHSRIYLQWAAAAGNLELVNLLLQKGSDVHYRESHGADAIQYAAQAGNKNTAVYDALIKAGSDAKIKDEDGATLMMYTVAYDDDLKLVDYFTSKGLSIKDKDKHGRTVADYAAKLGNFDIVQKLVSKGVKVTDQALFFAAQGSRAKQNGLEVFQKLITDYKLNPKAVNPKGETLLHAVARKPNAELHNFFLNQGVDVAKADNEGTTALMLVASGKNLELAKILLEKSKNINAKNEKGDTALSLAVSNSSAEMVKFLIDNGADVNFTDKEGNNLVYYWFNSFKAQANRGDDALSMQDFEAKQRVLENAGLDMSVPQKNGATLFHLAVAKNDLRLIKKAAEMGADIQAQDADGNSALHKAALTAKDDKILKELVALGINKSLKTEFEETAYDLAKENEFLTQKNINLDFLK